MEILLSIGDFSRMTYLSVKALRHYHEVGLLEPARVDDATGYRFYDASQVPTAQVIRRFRDLGMPLDHVKAVLAAPDVASRNALIATHLRQMEAELDATRATVASLRGLLERSPSPISVEYRSVSPAQSFAIAESVAMDDIERWWADAFEELGGALDDPGVGRAGPDGALYSNEFFEIEAGEVVAFVPVTGKPRPSGRVTLFDIPAAELAVTVHRGSFSDLDQTYGALGTFVAERELGVVGPIREYYESDDLTEVCWPVFHTTTKQER